jgi:drug/metabolite transporter superfamily protein YnfA
MNQNNVVSPVFGWLFALIVIAIGVANIILVHAVPGIIYLLLSLVFMPPVNAALKKQFDFGIPLVAKVVLGIVIIMFTLGVSDLGDIIDNAFMS